MKKWFVFAALVCAAVPSFSSVSHACPEGKFVAKGWNPGADPATQPGYAGTLTIVKSGESYQLEWKVGNDSFKGLGVCDAASGKLYAAYANLKTGWFGVIHYDKDLKGKWAISGDASGKWGTEYLTKAP